MHFHNYFELCVVTSGVGEFVHGEQVYPLMEGDVFIANPEIPHEIRLKGNKVESEELCLVFFQIHISMGPEKIPESYEEKMLHSFLIQHDIIRKFQNHLFSYLVFLDAYSKAKCIENFGLYNTLKNLALESIFALVKTQSSSICSPLLSDNVIDKAIQYINANLSRRLYISEISDYSRTSKRNLQYLFQKTLDITVTEYINERKTALAAGYLKMNFKANDVCVLIGIQDPAQFSRLFKKRFGLSPKQYQMKHIPFSPVENY